MKTINLIPADYKGNPQDAMGYCWEDIKTHTPGTDITSTKIEDALAHLAIDGEFTIAQHDDNFQGLEPIARINCMWAGGASYVILTGSIKPISGDSNILVDDGLRSIDVKTSKESCFDSLYNEGGEGYNPFR